MYSTRWQCIYRCTVTRGFRLMNIQSTRGKVLTATAALISLLERCKSVNRQQSLIFLGGAKRSKDGDDGEACEWWRNLWTVLQYWQAESVKYDTCFQKSSFFALATKVWTFRSQWLPNIFLCVQGWRYGWFCKWHLCIFASLHFLEMGQLVFHLLQEWIGINRLNPSFIVWKKSHLNRFFQAFERIHCSPLNKHENTNLKIILG